MSIIVNSRSCPQNHRCPMLWYCPVGAITQNGFGLPVIDETKCIACGKCAKLCPMKAVEMNHN